MLVKSLEEKYDIIYIDFYILTMFAKQSIYLSLHVDERILILHHRYVERFLFSMIDDDKTMTIVRMNASLIEECRTINYDNVLTF